MKNFYIDILEENRYTTDVIVAQGPKGDQGDPGETPPVDQTYNPESEYAQSGKAVAEAIEPKADVLELGSATGKAVAVTDSAEGKIIGLSVYGESAQDGTPSPEAPVEIESVENPVVTVLGRNILPFPYDGTANTYYQPGTDGSIAVAVENNQDTRAFTLRNSFTFLAGQTYLFSGIPDDFIVALYYKDENNADTWWTYKGTPHTFDETLTGRLYIQLNPGKNYTGTIYPMLSVGTQETDYEPYSQPQTVTIPYTLRGIKGSDGSWAARDEIVVDGKNQTVTYVQNVAVLTIPNTQTWWEWQTVNGSRIILWPTNKKTSGDTLGLFTIGGVNQNLNSVEDKQKSNTIYAFAGTYGTYWYPDWTAMGLTGTEEKAVADQKLQEWLAGISLKEFTYVRAEPSVTDITDTEAGQALLALVTHYPNTTVICDADCALRYKADTTIAYNNLLSRVAALEAAAVGQM